MAEGDVVVLRFTYDRALMQEAVASGGRALAGRQRGLRMFMPLLGGLATGAAMVLLAAQAPRLIGSEMDLMAVMFGFFFGALAIGLIYNLSQRGYSGLLLQSPVFRGEIEIELRPEGVLVRNDVSESALRWSAIDDLIENRRGLSLVIGANALPLPDDALPPGLDRTTLCRRLVAWRRAAA